MAPRWQGALPRHPRFISAQCYKDMALSAMSKRLGSLPIFMHRMIWLSATTTGGRRADETDRYQTALE